MNSKVSKVSPLIFNKLQISIAVKSIDFDTELQGEFFIILSGTTYFVKIVRRFGKSDLTYRNK
ncbi:MAG: hypothetical protein C0433_07975 [Cyclobacterium sp.]|nr:hypothetical protein [Cyclobacterium sp.]